MEEFHINLETAKLASENGFNLECRYAVSEDGHDDSLNFNGEQFFTQEDLNEAKSNTDKEHYFAPTIFELQSWLREKHNIDVVPYPVQMMKNTTVIEQLSGIEYSYYLFKNGMDLFVSHKPTSFERALEEGIQDVFRSKHISLH